MMKRYENGGNTEDDTADYSLEMEMFKYDMQSFLQNTQPVNWQKISDIHGVDVNNRIIQRFIHLQVEEIAVEGKSY